MSKTERMTEDHREVTAAEAYADYLAGVHEHDQMDIVAELARLCGFKVQVWKDDEHKPQEPAAEH
jgi:hypothetical protein